MTTNELKIKQAQYDALQKEYKAALYADPRNESLCLELAEKLYEVSKGTKLEDRQRQVVERHKGR